MEFNFLKAVAYDASRPLYSWYREKQKMHILLYIHLQELLLLLGRWVNFNNVRILYSPPVKTLQAIWYLPHKYPNFVEYCSYRNRGGRALQLPWSRSKELNLQSQVSKTCILPSRLDLDISELARKVQQKFIYYIL